MKERTTKTRPSKKAAAAPAPAPASSQLRRTTSREAPAPMRLRSPEPSTHEEIARRAYALFEARGYEHGHATEDWLRAERELAR